jgi:hypothetical protein
MFFSNPFEIPQYFFSQKEKSKLEFWMCWTKDRVEGISLSFSLFPSYEEKDTYCSKN